MTSSEQPPEDVDRDEEHETREPDEVDELQRQFDIAHDSPPPPAD